MEELIKLYSKDPDLLGQKGKMASDYVRDKYSPDKEQKDILDVWNKLLYHN